MSIKGIVLKIGGDTTALQKALKGIDESSRATNKELRDINRLLKFDTSNVELLAQKQKAVQTQLGLSENKLKKLKEAQEEARKSLQKALISTEEFSKIKRAVVEAEQNVERFSKTLRSLGKENVEIAKIRKELKSISSVKINENGFSGLSDVTKKYSRAVELARKNVDNLEKEIKDLQNNSDKSDFGRKKIENLEKALVEASNELEEFSEKEKNLEKVSKSFKKIEKFAELTGTSVKKLSDNFSRDLKKSIEQGTVSSERLEKELSKMANEGLKASVDISKLEKILEDVGNKDKNIETLKKSFENLKVEAVTTTSKLDKTAESIEKMSKLETFKGVLEGLSKISDKFKDVFSKGLESQNFLTKIRVQLGLNKKDIKKVRETIGEMSSFDIDGDEALEGIRRQLALNKKQSLDTNREIVKTASVIAGVYKGIDLTELIQETNEIKDTLGISQKESIGLVNTLLSVGFPPEQLDIIAEYSVQLKQAGYNAEDISGFLASGVNTGTWNIDNLLDGLKEGKIKMLEFAEELSPKLEETLNKAGIGIEDFQRLGKEIAQGGEKGKEAYTEVARVLKNVSDETLKNALGVEIYGTKWEDQGEKILDTILNAKDNTINLQKAQNKLNDDVSIMNSDPLVKFRQAMEKLATASIPLIEALTPLVNILSEFIEKNPEVTLGLLGFKSALSGIRDIAIASKGFGLSKSLFADSKIIKGLAIGTKTITGGAKMGGIGAFALMVGGTAKVIHDGIKNSNEAVRMMEESSKSGQNLHLLAAKYKGSNLANWEDIKKTTKYTFEEVERIVAEHTANAKLKGSENFNILKENNYKTMKETFENSGWFYDGIEASVISRTNKLKELGGENFANLDTEAKRTFQSTLESVGLQYDSIQGKIISSTTNAKNQSKANFSEIETDSKTAITGISNTFSKMDASFSESVENSRVKGTDLKNVFKDISAEGKKEFQSLEEKMLSSFTKSFEHISKGAGNFLSGLGEMFKNFSPKIQMPKIRTVNSGYTTTAKYIRGYDKGGVFTRPSVIGVAEKRPEFVGALDDLKGIIKSVITDTKTSSEIKHTGTIRIEGYNGSNYDNIIDIVIENLQRETRL